MKTEVKPGMSGYRWVVMTLIFVVYTVAHADRANIGFALPYIQEEFHINNTMAGLLVSLFFGGYAAGQIPAGYITGKVGVRRAYTLGMLFTSLCTGLMGVVDSIIHLKILRTLVGVSESPVVIGSTVTINNWFPAKEKGTATGLFLAASKCGPLVVPPICAWIILNYDWRHIFLFFAVPGAVLAILWYIMVPNHPEQSSHVRQGELDYINETSAAVLETKQSKRPFRYCWADKLLRTKKVDELRSSKEVFRCWDIYGAAFGYFFNVGTVGVLMSWLPKYLLQERHMAIMSSAIVAMAPFAGTVAGNVIGGWISDRFFAERRKPFMIISAVCTIITMSLLVHAPENLTLLSTLFFVMGLLLALGYSCYSVYAMGRADKATYPIAYSVINMGGQLGGMIMPLVVGVILDFGSWNAVFASLAGGALLCLLFVLTIVEPLPRGASM